MTEEILSIREIEVNIRSWQLFPATGGLFEVTLNGETIFSKKQSGRHAEPGEIKKLIEQKIADH